MNYPNGKGNVNENLQSKTAPQSSCHPCKNENDLSYGTQVELLTMKSNNDTNLFNKDDNNVKL